MKHISIPIEVSARHVHLTDAHIRKLFGRELTVLKPISQIGQFAARETVDVKTDNCALKIENVRVVGPARSESQVELTATDCRMLGLQNVPIRVSGDHRNTPGITLIGPKGTVHLKKGVLIAARHIHCPTSKARDVGLKDNQKVVVRIGGNRGVVFENVIVRVRNDYVWRLHLDTDEANAAGILSGGRGVVLL